MVIIGGCVVVFWFMLVMGESIMVNIIVIFIIIEFCLYIGVMEEELNEIVGFGVIEFYEDDNVDW